MSSTQAVQSQEVPASLAPIRLAQTPTLPSLYPTDVTPVNIGRERELLKPGLTYYLFQNLPAKLWFNATVETSQRYETNVFFSRTRYVSDYVYRILPNITLGYELFKKISVYTNYFVIKDVFVGHHQLTFPTTQSLSMGMRRQFTVSPRTNLQLDFQARELWQTVGLHQFDFIPSTTITRFVTPRTIIYANLLLQLRGGQYFVAPTREIDPFYTIGALHTRGNWMFTAVGTLVTNFRHPPFNDSIPPFSNNSIICDFEVAHPLPKIPYMVAFVRAEPIWNWNGHGLQGISGMDFRLFSGVRMSVAKPTYGSSIKRLKQQLQDFNMGPAGIQNGLPPITPAQPSEPEPLPPAPTTQFGPQPSQLSVPESKPSGLPPTIPLQAVPQSLPSPAAPSPTKPSIPQAVPAPSPAAPSKPALQPAKTSQPAVSQPIAPQTISPKAAPPQTPASRPVSQPTTKVPPPASQPITPVPQPTPQPTTAVPSAPTKLKQTVTKSHPKKSEPLPNPSPTKQIPRPTESTPERILETVPEFAPENY